VVSHTCLDQLRSLGRWQWADLEELETGRAAAVVAPRMAADQEDRDLVQRVLRQVSADCREMWSLIAMGHSYREMSERLGVAEGTLRVRVLRCREKATALRRGLLGASGAPGRNTRAAQSPTLSERVNDDGM
jgi:DNA-directed RNA polymerase specialized sigma24 family protein